MDGHAHAAAHGGDHHDIEIPFTVHARPDTGVYNGNYTVEVEYQ